MSELTFAIDGDALLWTGDGEYLRIEPWGKNSVRVRASKMHEIQEQDGALLPQNNQASGSHNYMASPLTSPVEPPNYAMAIL